MNVFMRLTSVMIILFVSTNMLSAQDSLNLKRIATHDTGATKYNDIWGYVYEDEEYMVYGAENSINIMKVTDCSNPVLMHQWVDGTTTTWRDFKSYGDYIYAVCDGGGCTEGLQTIHKDTMSFAQWQSTDDFLRAHNIFIDEVNARLYAVGTNTQNKGIIVYDLSVTPGAPTLMASVDLGVISEEAGSWYVHDVYVRDNIAYTSHGDIGTYAIWDFTDPTAPVLLGSSTCDGLGDYNHSSWVTPDLQYAYIAEEVPQKPMTILDISDVENIEYLGQFHDPLIPGPQYNRAHNPFIHGDLLYISYYHDGLKIYDISEPEKPVVEGYYDTYPSNTNYNGYKGAWGVYPYLPSGCIGVSDYNTGLHLLRHEVTNTSRVDNADLVFSDNNTGIIFRKDIDSYVRLSMNLDGTIAVNPIASLPANYEEIKRSNLYVSQINSGMTYDIGKVYTISIDDFGELVSTLNAVNAIPNPNLTVAQDFVIKSMGSGLILKSPGGTCWKVSIDLDNNIVSEALSSCP